jgi:acyl-CoA thioesterase-1
VAQKTSSVLAPFILEQVALNPALVQEDGIHPTVEAQPLMLDTLLPTILRELTD